MPTSDGPDQPSAASPAQDFSLTKFFDDAYHHGVVAAVEHRPAEAAVTAVGAAAVVAGAARAIESGALSGILKKGAEEELPSVGAANPKLLEQIRAASSTDIIPGSSTPLKGLAADDALIRTLGPKPGVTLISQRADLNLLEEARAAGRGGPLGPKGQGAPFEPDGKPLKAPSLDAYMAAGYRHVPYRTAAAKIRGAMGSMLGDDISGHGPLGQLPKSMSFHPIVEHARDEAALARLFKTGS